jgi:hypothetical protein
MLFGHGGCEGCGGGIDGSGCVVVGYGGQKQNQRHKLPSPTPQLPKQQIPHSSIQGKKTLQNTTATLSTRVAERWNLFFTPVLMFQCFPRALFASLLLVRNAL